MKYFRITFRGYLSRGVGLISLLGLIMFFVRGVAYCYGTEDSRPIDRIVAVINEDIITLYDLDQAVKPYSEKIRSMGYSIDNEQKMLYKVRHDVLNQLIDEKLTDQEIKRTNITVNDQEVDAAIEQVKSENYFSDEDLRQALAKDGLTMEEYRKRTHDQILRSKLVSYRIKSKIVITDEDVKAYYEKHKKDYAGLSKYHLRTIIMPVQSLSDEEKKIVHRKMETILELLKEGQAFEVLAAKYSQSSLAEDGGNLGFFKLDDLDASLRKAIKDLKPGEYTPILNTEQGYQIMYVDDIVNLPGQTLKEASSKIQEKLYNEALEKEFKTWLSNLRKESHIKVIQ